MEISITLSYNWSLDKGKFVLLKNYKLSPNALRITPPLEVRHFRLTVNSPEDPTSRQKDRPNDKATHTMADQENQEVQQLK